MNSRALMLFGALLTAPLYGWAQESPATAPAATPPVFDLRNPGIRKIVQENAETQYASVVHVKEANTERASLEDVFVTEVIGSASAPAVVKQAPQYVLAEPLQGLLSAVFETVVDETLDELLDVRDDEVWLSCQGRDMLEASRIKYEACPGRGNPPHNAPGAQSPQVR